MWFYFYSVSFTLILVFLCGFFTCFLISCPDWDVLHEHNIIIIIVISILTIAIYSLTTFRKPYEKACRLTAHSSGEVFLGAGRQSS